MNKKLFFCVAVFSALLCSCAVRELALTEGEFEAPVPHNFIGVGRYLPESSTINSITLSGAYVPSATLRVRGLKNEPEDCNEEYTDCDFIKGHIDFLYRLDRFPVMASFTRLYKSRIAIAGFAAGISKYMYARFIFGMNNKNYELGMYGDLGYGFSKGAYSYKQREYSLFESLEYGESSYSDDNIGHFVTAFGGFASIYYGNFGVTYSPTLYAPWRRRDLPIKEDYEDFDTFFDFPKIVSQYVGISYWITDHWKLSYGGTFLTPVGFNDVAITANTSIGYWF